MLSDKALNEIDCLRFQGARGSQRARAFASDFLARPFVGREAELAALDAWRGARLSRALVVAPAGMGKSTLLLQWARAQAEPVAWAPVSVHYDLARGDVVRALLRGRLKTIAGPQSAPGNWVDLAATGEAIVVVDGLDELSDPSLVDDLRSLSPTARVVIGVREQIDRNAEGWRRYLDWRDITVISPGNLSRRAVADLFPDPAQAADVMNHTGGDPLLVSMAAEAGPHLLEWNLEATLDPHTSRALGALAEAVAPMPKTLLTEVTGLDSTILEQALHRAGRFIISTSTGLTLAHPRIGEEVQRLVPAALLLELRSAFAKVLRRERGLLLARGTANGHTGYLLNGLVVHLVNGGAAVDELHAVLDGRWLRAWEESERGRTGFVADVMTIWAEADRLQAKRWSDDAASLQFYCAALAALSAQDEETIDKDTRAESVRLGLRSQQAAIDGLGAISSHWDHAQTVRALLEVLDERGFNALLATAPRGERDAWPCEAVARRLMRMGLEEEAIDWALSPIGGTLRPPNVRSVFADLSPKGRKRVQGRLREYLVARTPDPAYLPSAVTAAAMLPKDEQMRWLEVLVGWIAPDDELFWDCDDGQTDPRLDLAEAAARSGLPMLCQSLFARVLHSPYPFVENTRAAGSEVAASMARAALALDDEALLAHARHVGNDRLEAVLSFFELGKEEPLGTRLTGLIDTLKQPEAVLAHLPALTIADAPLVRHASMAAPSPALGLHVLDLVRAAAKDLSKYANAYALYAGLLQALGNLAAHLDDTSAKEARDLVWHEIHAKAPTPVKWGHILSAIVPLLVRQPDDAVRKAVLSKARANPTLVPSLCAVPQWRVAFTDREQQAYVAGRLGHRAVTEPSVWVHLLHELSNSLDDPLRTESWSVALDLALGAHEWELATRIARDAPALWRRTFRALRDVREDGRAVWALARLMESAPNASDRHAAARAAWAHPKLTAGMGCAGTLLDALPTAEAEAIARKLLAEDRLGHIRLEELPPVARNAVRARRRRADRTPLQRATDVLKDNLPDDPTSKEDRRLVLEHLRSSPPKNDAWAVLDVAARWMEANEVREFADFAVDSERHAIVAQMAERLRMLGDLDGERALLRKSTPPPRSMLAIRKALVVGTLDELYARLDENPRAVSYPWVLKGVRARGWADAFVQRLDGEATDVRLRGWHALLPDLSKEAQKELRPKVIASLHADIRDQTRSRHHYWSCLTVHERRALWNEERAARTHRRASKRIHGAPSPALGLAEAHTELLLSLLRMWQR
ncbi:MAG: hypothetical protein AAGF12_06110 [Myxococcota bacterium]